MINKVKKLKEILFWSSFLGLSAVFTILIVWFRNTEIGKSPLTNSIVVAVVLLPMIIYDFDSIPFLKRNINKKNKNK